MKTALGPALATALALILAAGVAHAQTQQPSTPMGRDQN